MTTDTRTQAQPQRRMMASEHHTPSTYIELRTDYGNAVGDAVRDRSKYTAEALHDARAALDAHVARIIAERDEARKLLDRWLMVTNYGPFDTDDIATLCRDTEQLRRGEP